MNPNSVQETLFPLLVFGYIFLYPPIFCAKKSCKWVFLNLGNVLCQIVILISTIHFLNAWVRQENIFSILFTCLTVFIWLANVLTCRWGIFLRGRRLGGLLLKLWKLSEGYRDVDFLKKRWILKLLVCYIVLVLVYIVNSTINALKLDKGEFNWIFLLKAVSLHTLALGGPMFIVILWLICVESMSQLLTILHQHLETVKNLDNMTRLCHYHRDLCGIQSDLDQILSILIGPVIMNSSFSAIYAIYYVLTELDEISLHVAVSFLQSALFNFILLFHIYIKGGYLENKGRSCLKPLYSIPTSYSSNEMNQEIERFKSQILSFPMSMTIWGAFKINRSSLIGILSLGVTYLIILLQFRSSNVSDVAPGTDDSIFNIKNNSI